MYAKQSENPEEGQKKRQKQHPYSEDKTVLFHAAGCDS